MSSEADHFHYMFFVNGKKIQRRGKLLFSDTATHFSKLKKPLSAYTSLDKPNQIVSLSEIWIEKRETTSYRLILEEAPLCYENFNPNTAPKINWQVYCQSKANYMAILMEDEIGNYKKNLYQKYYPGMDTAIKYYPMLHMSGITDPRTYHEGEQLMAIYFQNTTTVKTNKSNTQISLHGNTISVSDYTKYEIEARLYHMFMQNLELGNNSIFPDVDVRMMINKVEKDINIRSYDEFQEITKAIHRLNSPVYTIHYSELFGGSHELRTITPMLNPEDDVEIISEYSYESDRNFRLNGFNMKFTYRNTSRLNFEYYHEIKFKYPEGQVLTEFDTSFCRHNPNERLLIYRYTSVNDIPVWTEFTYQDKDALYYKIWRVVNHILFVLLFVTFIFLYAERPKISPTQFLNKFRLRISVFVGITQSVYIVSYGLLQSNFGFFQGLVKSFGLLLVIGLLLWVAIYFYERERNIKFE